MFRLFGFVFGFTFGSRLVYAWFTLGSRLVSCLSSVGLCTYLKVFEVDHRSCGFVGGVKRVV